MFIKLRKLPPFALKCEALIRNLPQHHVKLQEINSEFSRVMAGYNGEKTLDYHLGGLNPNLFDIYPDLRLENNNRYFQIDALLLSNKFIICISNKNLTGELEFDPSKGQLIQRKGDSIKVYEDPIAQAQKHRLQMIQWLEKNKFPPIPIDFLVVISNTNANIKKVVGASNHYWKLCRGINLQEKIGYFEKIYANDFITTKERRKLGKLLLKKDTPFEIDIINHFKISKVDLPNGVICPNCYNRPMIHTFNIWECQICGCKSKTAHMQNIQDYFLLTNQPLTNRIFREVTCLNSRYKATRILNSMNLPHQGSNKGRVYLPFPTDK